MRLSIVDFVNAWPLTWGFRTGRVAGVETIRDIPAACADRLVRREVDGGLVPVAALAGAGDYQLVRGLGIAARREVRTVLLVSKVPVSEISSVALDVASRSSAALVRLLLSDRWGREVEFHPGASDLRELLRHHDAGLLIGDPALALSGGDLEGLHVFDLAAEWNDWTGLPFVFAVWAVRRGTDPAPFHASRRHGADSIDEIVREGARCSGRSEGEIRIYLTQRLCHDLGVAEERGLEEFVRRARRAGILPEGPEFEWTPAVGAPLVSTPEVGR